MEVKFDASQERPLVQDMADEKWNIEGAQGKLTNTEFLCSFELVAQIEINPQFDADLAV